MNRVWQHHFGPRLVRTSSDFGALGDSPTHPELLDWLTNEFISGGWSPKSLLRVILTSETYQLSSELEESSFRNDGEKPHPLATISLRSPKKIVVNSTVRPPNRMSTHIHLFANGPTRNPDGPQEWASESIVLVETKGAIDKRW
ncbi:MAG: DUF1553 domain-containing protein [Pseudomonadota bacterium]